MFLIIVDHTPRQRNKYPSDWKTISPTRVAAIVPDGEYWLAHCRRWSSTVSISLEDLTNKQLEK